MVFLTGTGCTTNLLRRSFLPRFMSWRLMKHREFREMIDCVNAFQALSLLGGPVALTVIEDPLSPPSHQHGHLTSQLSGKLLTPKHYKGDKKSCCVRACRACRAAQLLKAWQQEPQSSWKHTKSRGTPPNHHLLIPISRGCQLCSVLGGQHSPVGASDLPLQEKTFRSTRTLQSILVQSTSMAYIPHSVGLWVFRKGKNKHFQQH